MSGEGQGGVQRPVVEDMTVYAFGDRHPRVASSAFVSPSATVIGDVTIGEECIVLPGAVIRGDYGEVVVGAGTSVQDNVIVHARPEGRTVIGEEVTLGHGCVVHNAVVDDLAVIGIRAVVSDFAVVGRWAVVAEGAVVTQGSQIPAGKVAVGVPARVIGDLRPEHREELARHKAIYRELARTYADRLVAEG